MTRGGILKDTYNYKVLYSSIYTKIMSFWGSKFHCPLWRNISHTLAPYPMPFLLLRRASYIVRMYVPEIFHIGTISSKEYPGMEAPIKLTLSQNTFPIG